MLLKALAEGRRDERGVYAILFAILIVVLFTMVAIGVDLSDARAEVRANQSRSDFAALAAGAHLPADPAAACDAAWAYLVSNTPGFPSGATSPCDSGVPQGFDPICTETSPAVEYEALGEAPFDVVFVFPVTANHPLMAGGGGDVDVDGDPCERFGVLITTDRSPLFGGVLGSAGLEAPATAVIRGFEGNQVSHAVALLLLDPYGCTSLEVTGQGGVQIYAHGTDDPGRITVDSNGTKENNPNNCGNDEFTMESQGTTNGAIKACGNAIIPGDESRCDPGGVISLFAYRPGQTTCLVSSINHACNPQNLSTNRLLPVPVRATARATRAPADHEWNCKTSYPGYQPYSDHPAIPIRTCEEGTPAYVDQLNAYIGATGNTIPTGFVPLPAAVTCNAPDGTVVPPGNYYVDCTGSGFRVGSGNTVTFQGGNVVFRGSVNIQGHLRFNTANPTAHIPDSCRRPNDLCPLASSDRQAYMYLRNGGTLSKGAQGQLTFNHTSVFLTSGGSVNVGAGDPVLTWTAPQERNSPTVDDPATPNVDESSPASPFDKLALWSESRADHVLGGQAPLNIEGVFFTPNALFNYNGAASQFLDRAQFLTFRMNVSGQGTLRMQPDPDFVLRIPVQGFFLIR